MLDVLDIGINKVLCAVACIFLWHIVGATRILSGPVRSITVYVLHARAERPHIISLRVAEWQPREKKNTEVEEPNRAFRLHALWSRLPLRRFQCQQIEEDELVLGETL